MISMVLLLVIVLIGEGLISFIYIEIGGGGWKACTGSVHGC